MYHSGTMKGLYGESENQDQDEMIISEESVSMRLSRYSDVQEQIDHVIDTMEE